LGEDPIGFASGDFNFYRYVGNEPINLTDPSGHFWVWVIRGGKWVYQWISKAPKPIKPRKIPKPPKKGTWVCIGKLRYAPPDCMTDCPHRVVGYGPTKAIAQRSAKFTPGKKKEKCAKYYGHFECHKL
jgi:hypothetical protein